jgi:Protein of unknown function (DUF4058)
VSMIFPGMDPYLESPLLWSGVHAALVVYLRDQLQPLIRPRYLATIEERVYLEGPDRDMIPDAPWVAVAPAGSDAPILMQIPSSDVHETYVAILERQPGERVVTVIEVLSPTNKYAGPGRTSYLAKQEEMLRGPVHLVEIDLLRAGPHVLAVAEYAARREAEYDYLVCVSRAPEPRITFELYPRRLRERLPRLGVPLAESDPDAVLDLQAAVAKVYEAGCYADRLHYDRPCMPSLSADDKAWADQQVAAARQNPDGA